MRMYKKILALCSIPFLTTCQTVKTSLPFLVNTDTYIIGNYRYLELQDGKIYSAPEFLYQLFENQKYRIHNDYMESLQNPEKIEKCLDEIDTDNDLNITIFEAIQTAASPERVQKLEEILKE